MASSVSSRGNIAAIVGVGPKLGRSIARKFAHEGYTIAILARDLGTYIHTYIDKSFLFLFYYILSCCREIVWSGGRDSEGGESTGVCNTYRLLRLQKRQGCIRRSALARIRGGSCLQR